MYYAEVVNSFSDWRLRRLNSRNVSYILNTNLQIIINNMVLIVCIEHCLMF